MPDQYDWTNHLLAALQALWPTDRPLTLDFVSDSHAVWRMHDNVADGACQIRTDGITIYLPARAEDTEYWRDVLIHEYAHAAMAGLLDLIQNEVPVGSEAYRKDAYVQQMELVTAYVAALLEYAIKSGAQRRPPEPVPESAP